MHLNDNDLATLPADLFDKLTALTDLQLNGNPGADFSPTADALPDDRTVPPAGGTVELDGSGSDGGPWGTNVTYSWSQTSGPTSGVTFDDDTSATPVVTIPALTAGTELTFTLTVAGRATDTSFGTAPDTDTATVTVLSTDAVASTCLAPNLAGRMQIWTGTVTVGANEVGGEVGAYGFGTGYGELDDTQFSVGTNDYTVDLAIVEGSASPLEGQLFVQPDRRAGGGGPCAAHAACLRRLLRLGRRGGQQSGTYLPLV